MIKKPPKVYIHGAVGRQKDIEKLFNQVGISNPLELKFGDPYTIYFVNQKGEISMTVHGTDLYYVIENSSDWVELKLKQPKKEHKFLITVKEGSSSCDGCAALNRCTEKQKAKCQIAKSLEILIDDSSFIGKNLDIVELDTRFGPVTPYSKEDFGDYG